MERRTHRIGVSVNQAEQESIEAKARAAGLRPAVYLREVGLGAGMNQKRSDHLYHRLSRLGLMAKHLSEESGATGRTHEADPFETLLAEILDIRGEV